MDSVVDYLIQMFFVAEEIFILDQISYTYKLFQWKNAHFNKYRV